MSVNICDDKTLKDLYHEIIKYEVKLQEYLNARGAKGLTYFQLKALKQIIASFRDKNVYVITAPAGSGFR